MNMQNLNNLVEQTAHFIIQSSRIVVFTGAGISTESGIPDFRGKGGLWTKFDPEDFTIERFLSNPESRRIHWKVFREGGLTSEAQPNAAHYAIAEMEKLNKLDCIITQNVDNLHQRAGNSPGKIYELHGNFKRVRCLRCGLTQTIEEVLTKFEDEEIPVCDKCRGILKPDVVFFGEALPQKVLENATNHARNCDLFIVIGSTLVVYPAAYLPAYAVESGAKLIIINLGTTPLDYHAEVLISAKAGEVMKLIMEAVKRELEIH
jgi:NAD-dependent deacetylase